MLLWLMRDVIGRFGGVVVYEFLDGVAGYLVVLEACGEIGVEGWAVKTLCGVAGALENACFAPHLVVAAGDFFYIFFNLCDFGGQFVAQELYFFFVFRFFVFEAGYFFIYFVVDGVSLCAEGFELFLTPRGGNRDVGGEEVFPFDVIGVQQSRYIRFKRFDSWGEELFIGDIGGEVFVGEVGE